MAYINIIWDLEEEPDGNVQHIAEHELTREEVEEVLQDPLSITVSRSTGRPIAFGETSEGRYIAVIYIEIDSDTARPVTAYEVER
jgi:uncharacterized DUF497 family protein